NGTTMRFAEDIITVLRYPWLPKELPRGVHTADLSDGTRVTFGEREVVLSLGHGTVVALDLAGRAACFIGGALRRVDVGNIFIDACFGLLLLAHIAFSTERVQRAGASPFPNG